MNCPSCKKEVVADRFFCTWCEVLMPNPSAGTKAGLFRRWFATAIDFLLYVALLLFVAVVMGSIFGRMDLFVSIGFTIFAMIFATTVYVIFCLLMLVKGATPGKWILDEQVVNKEDGGYPGLWKMILREMIGKFVSGLFLGIGYFWAIFDNDNQAWHDKIAGTVVVKKGVPASAMSPLVTSEPRFVMAAAAAAPSMPVTERFCSNCGGKNPTASNFCGHCGGRV